LRSKEIVSNRQECGIESLYVCLRNAGIDHPDLEKMRKELITNSNGLSASSLIAYAKNFDVHLYPAKVNLKTLTKWNIPAILHVDDDHFIVFLGMDRQRMLIFDNGIGYYDSTPEWFEKHYQWNNTALLLKKPPSAFQVLFDSVFLSVILIVFVGILLLKQIFYPKTLVKRCSETV
jgi:ABC-type bacteriocin/lantibiotic exporter with double-glycine peptidase domain